MAKFPSEEQDRFIVRMPEGMRDRLKEEAERNKRSMNAEIVARIERSFELAKLIRDLERAEIRLGEQSETERRLRRQVELLQIDIDELKEGRNIDLGNEAVQKAMVDQVQAVMGSVIADMREEHRLTNGLHLLLEWFATNPEERAEYEELSEGEREEYAREKTHQLWIEHLNRQREKRGKRPAALPKPTRKVRLDDK